MEIIQVNPTVSDIDMQNIIYYRIEEILTSYDHRLFQYLREGEYAACDQLLSDFCFELIELPDEKQVFIARIFFVSVVTDVIRVQKRKGRLHPRNLTFAYNLIAHIEAWDNLSDFILNSTYFIDKMKDHIMTEEYLIQGCPHMINALKLIDTHLQKSYLTVSWIAKQLNISRTHLTNLFKLRIGDTVSLYISKRKLNEIVFEMTYTSKPLKEIRESYGYYNHSHFIQHFKKYFGTTPLKYKQNMQY